MRRDMRERNEKDSSRKDGAIRETPSFDLEGTPVATLAPTLLPQFLVHDVKCPHSCDVNGCHITVKCRTSRSGRARAAKLRKAAADPPCFPTIGFANCTLPAGTIQELASVGDGRSAWILKVPRRRVSLQASVLERRGGSWRQPFSAASKILRGIQVPRLKGRVRIRSHGYRGDEQRRQCVVCLEGG